MKKDLEAIVHAFLPLRATHVYLEPRLSLSFQDALKTHARVSHVDVGRRPKMRYHYMMVRKTSTSLRSSLRRLESCGVLCLVGSSKVLGRKARKENEAVLEEIRSTMVPLTWSTPSPFLEAFMKP